MSEVTQITHSERLYTLTIRDQIQVLNDMGPRIEQPYLRVDAATGRARFERGHLTHSASVSIGVTPEGTVPLTTNQLRRTIIVGSGDRWRLTDTVVRALEAGRDQDIPAPVMIFAGGDFESDTDRTFYPETGAARCGAGTKTLITALEHTKAIYARNMQKLEDFGAVPPDMHHTLILRETQFIAWGDPEFNHIYYTLIELTTDDAVRAGISIIIDAKYPRFLPKLLLDRLTVIGTKQLSREDSIMAIGSSDLYDVADHVAAVRLPNVPPIAFCY